MSGNQHKQKMHVIAPEWKTIVTGYKGNKTLPKASHTNHSKFANYNPITAAYHKMISTNKIMVNPFIDEKSNHHIPTLDFSVDKFLIA